MEGMEKGRRFWSPRRFQWETFYGENDSTSWEDLSHDIWHIHGNLARKAFSSVLFSTEDYFNAVSHFRSISGNPLKDDWKGNYTWLKLFMEYPLIVAGLGLDEGELLLRHLLMVRRKYRRLKKLEKDECPSCFLYAPSKEEDKANTGNCDVSRKLLQGPPNPFLDLMGFECIQFDSYDKLYNLDS